MAGDAPSSAPDTGELDAKEKWYTSAAALSIGIICLVFGTPLWWKTTDVYRADIPHSSIDELAVKKLTIGIDVEAVIITSGDKAELRKLGEALSSALKDTTPDCAISLIYRTSTREAEKAEREAFVTAPADVQEIERKLPLDNDAPGKYSFYVVPDGYLSGVALPLLGSRRNAFIRHSSDVHQVAESIKNIVDSVINKESILKTYRAATGHSAIEQTDKDHMRAAKSSHAYDIIFSLLVADPSVSRVEWDFKRASQNYLNPLKNMMSDYVSLTFKSQVLYYTGLAVEPKADNESNEHYLLSTDLPHLINPVEGKLGSFVTKSPALNFLVYVPRPSEQPLFIRSQSGDKAEVNAFLTPRWGGLFIYNYNSTTGSGANTVEVDVKSALEVFLPQLRLLLGIRQVAPAGVQASEPGANIITSWELDSWLRERIVENLALSTQTLNSLTQLVEKIRNMVINDDVGSEVARAVSAALRSHTQLAKSQLASAFVLSQEAMLSSEAAFYDPSLLELLYFPEDQKFAIYIPLFLPIGLPIIGSTVSALRWLLGQRRRKEKAA